MKRILALLFVLIFSWVCNTNGITTYALNADLAMGYHVMISQNILYYNYNDPYNSKILNLQEVLFYQVGDQTFTQGQYGWILKNGTEIFDYDDNGMSPYAKYTNDMIIVYTSMKEWFFHISNSYEDVYNQAVYSLEGNTPVLSFYTAYDFTNFDRDYREFEKFYKKSEVVHSNQIENDYYFKNLHQNIGDNINGSCAYVALGSLLSYYDIFYNDDIIPDTYTINGVTKKFMEDEYIGSSDLTKCTQSPGYTEEFHQFLINEVGKTLFHTVKYELTIPETCNVLQYYLQNYTNVSSNDYSLNLLYSKQSIKNYIDNNIPVMVFVQNWLNDDTIDNIYSTINTRIGLGHAIITYGYAETSSGKTFYQSHLGYQSSNAFSNKMVYSYDDDIFGLAIDFKQNNNNCSQAYVYKDTESEAEFTYCVKCNQYTGQHVEINCRINHESNIEIKENGRILYPFETQCDSRYDITLSSDKSLQIVLYKEDGTLIEEIEGYYFHTDDYRGYTIRDLSKGKYYLKVSYYDTTHSGTIHTTIQPRNTTPIPDITELSEVDVLPHLHDNHNVFRIYTNQNKLYQLKLVATATQPIDYPDNAITITDTEGTIVSRFPDNTLQATTTNASNNLLFYAEKGKSYNLHIDIEQEGIQSLRLFITTQDEFISSTMTSYDSYTEPLTTINGDSGKSITIEREGTYQFHFYYKGTQTTDTYMTLLKQNAEGEYTFLTSQALNKTNRHLYYTDTITAPTTYFIAYINATENETIDIDIGKEITQIFTIKTDISTTDCGSEVKLNNGTLGGTTITQGFTRNVYLGENAPDTTSRLKYNWYSLNPNIAKISAYGTITAVGVGTTTIQAVYKDDPSQVAELEITVIPYTEQTEPISLQYGMDVRMDGTLTGSEVTSGKGNSIPVDNHPEVTIHIGYTRLICLGADSPNSSIQDFTWTVVQEEKDTGMVTVSSYGTIKGTQAGTITVKGTYKYNPNYQVSIRIQVVN